jgi:hypothetical protein
MPFRKDSVEYLPMYFEVDSRRTSLSGGARTGLRQSRDCSALTTISGVRASARLEWARVESAVASGESWRPRRSLES